MSAGVRDEKTLYAILWLDVATVSVLLASPMGGHHVYRVATQNRDKETLAGQGQFRERGGTGGGGKAMKGRSSVISWHS